jgi:hypothetical protein
MEQKLRVLDLYKRMLYSLKGYYKPYYESKILLKNVFLKNQNIKENIKIEELLEKGEYIISEIEATHKLKKYRTLKKNYY